MPKVVYFSPSFAPYRVPVFDALYQHLKDNFRVVALNKESSEIGCIALHSGIFPRTLIYGRRIALSRYHNKGQETPLEVIFSPSFPWILRALQPAVVISNNFNLWTLISLLMRYRTVIFWEGTHHTERTVKSWRDRLRRWMVQKARAFVVNGKQSREYLEFLGADPQHIFEGGMCAEPVPKQYQASHPRRIEPGEAVRFLFVGRLIDLKGVHLLLQAVQQLAESVDRKQSFEVWLIGKGPERERYEALSRELDVTSWVHFGGGVRPERIWEFYAQCHVFVLPTLQDNWPLVVPEAMSMGMPVLLSKHAGSVPDLIEEDGNGWSFDPTDPMDLAKRMLAYLQEPGLVEMHGARSLQLVKPYTPARTAAVFLRAIELVS